MFLISSEVLLFYYTMHISLCVWFTYVNPIELIPSTRRYLSSDKLIEIVFWKVQDMKIGNGNQR